MRQPSGGSGSGQRSVDRSDPRRCADLLCCCADRPPPRLLSVLTSSSRQLATAASAAVHLFRLAATTHAPPSSRRRVSSSSDSDSSSSRSAVPAADGQTAGSVVAAQSHECRVLTTFLAVCDCDMCAATAAGRLYQVRTRRLCCSPPQIRPPGFAALQLPSTSLPVLVDAFPRCSLLTCCPLLLLVCPLTPLRFAGGVCHGRHLSGRRRRRHPVQRRSVRTDAYCCCVRSDSDCCSDGAFGRGRSEFR